MLLQERDEHPAIDPEKWSLCGGHLEPGEEYHVGALRELEEETGIRMDLHELELWTEIEIVHEAYGSVDTMQVFVGATALTDDDVVLGEGRQIVFVEPAVVPTLDLSPTALRIVPAFLESDHYRRLTR
ncbi:hypothetical protein GCM10009844_38000 [Nocardioides koreensis]|uniref:Nudix hydrolase domain-containing protein n=1 Tax=Nocardioides koreensis TaxID=433651 RepID=A0ABP5LTM3_9ACTN